MNGCSVGSGLGGKKKFRREPGKISESVKFIECLVKV